VSHEEQHAPFKIEITDPTAHHCFLLTINPKAQPGVDGPDRIEIMIHAVALVGLIHQCSLALSEWQRQTTEELLRQITGLTADEMRAKGFIA
jgi:hypothetical protein